MICSGQGCLSAPAPISYNGNMTPFYVEKHICTPFPGQYYDACQESIMQKLL